MSKILCIQFRINKNSVIHEQKCILREIKDQVQVDFVDGLDASLDWSSPEKVLFGYEGLILGGSGELDFDGNRDIDDKFRSISYEILDRLKVLFEYIFEKDVATLGICYGHQMLGAFAGATVRYDEEQKKSCSHQVRLIINKDEHLLFSDLPEIFTAHYGHKDVLDRVPEGAVLLMEGGDKCRVSALRYKKNIYTVQFHPELCFEDMLERIKVSPGYLPETVLAKEVFSRDSCSNTILTNFGRMVALRSKD